MLTVVFMSLQSLQFINNVRAYVVRCQIAFCIIFNSISAPIFTYSMSIQFANRLGYASVHGSHSTQLKIFVVGHRTSIQLQSLPFCSKEPSPFARVSSA